MFNGIVNHITGWHAPDVRIAIRITCRYPDTLDTLDTCHVPHMSRTYCECGMIIIEVNPPLAVKTRVWMLSWAITQNGAF